MDTYPIEVISYSGYKGEERPLRFIFDGREYKVREIMESSYQADPEKGLRREFKLKTEENLFFHIYYDEEKGGWFLIKQIVEH
ncbi:MAG: hypothetical protein AMJ42_03985 [Deltaproteobacteria bacterium DG_8]|nr:MAG: hypothetical protein AMJ42_03985 [Deltaproteobacteria bacterium DG_8]